MDSTFSHPYYPSDLLLYNYLPNDDDLSSVAGKFIAMWIVILVSTWYLSTLVSPQLSKLDKSIVLWFILCE